MYDRIDNSTCCYHGGKTDFERRHGVAVSVSISSIFTRLFERYLESIDRTSNAFRFNVSRSCLYYSQFIQKFGPSLSRVRSA